MPTIPRLKDKYKRDNKLNQSAKYYNSLQWHKLRDWYMHKNPLCENCLKNGKTTAGECVHHKQFILSVYNNEDRFNLLTDVSNIMTLCNSCHRLMHAYAKENHLNYIDYLKLE